MELFSIFFYNVAMLLYYAAIKVAAVFSPKAKDWINGRKAVTTQLQSFSTPVNANRIWIHCSSLGEFEQARPLIEKIKQSKPSAFIFLTFFSPSGYNIRQSYKFADMVCYLPHDTKTNAQKLISAFKPTLVLWTKYDFYYHFLNELNLAKVPVMLFAARFLPNQIFFKNHGWLFQKILQSFTRIYVQDTASKKLLANINIESELANDTRFDRVIAIAREHKTFPEIEQFIAGRKTIVCGSTWLPDEELLTAIINTNVFENAVWLVAPHNVTSTNVAHLQKMLKGNSVLLSKLNENAQGNVLIIDSIGQLSSLYVYADVAYIGGGFGASVHNVLEAAVYGVPVLFGKNYQKSFECIDLIREQGGFSINSKQELEEKINMLFQKNTAVKTGEIARSYVLNKAGGTEKIFTFVEQHLTD